MLSKQELLAAVNTINNYDGGTHRGTMGEFFVHHGAVVDTAGSHTNQNLIRAALVPDGDYFKIQFGFCQSSITRAPSGGFPLEIPADLLKMCHTQQDVLSIWDAMHGNQKERMTKIREFLDTREPEVA